MASNATTKRGICVPWNFAPEHFSLYADAISAGKIGWICNWEMWKPQGLPSNITYVPMCRTGSEATQINDYLTGYSTDPQVQEFMVFNEPDIESQANLSVDHAVELWKQYVPAAKSKLPQLRLGCPAVSNGPNGIPWLKDFFTKLGGVDASGVDFVVIHWYGPDFENFKNYVEEAHRTFKKPLWITEFACTNWNAASPISHDAVLSFIRKALDYLDHAPHVERYAWFGAMEDVGEGVGRSNGFQQNGKLLEVGRIYTMQ